VPFPAGAKLDGMALERWKAKAGRLKQEARALYAACRDPRTPWYARALGIGVLAYALSPIDLIPDVVPVLGYLDDAILVPLGILAVVALMPKDVMAECRARAEAAAARPVSRAGAVFILAVWLALAGAALWWLLEG
jgi:uncharacterized membrane protein YkvA (DUF1232 family)